MNNLKHLTDQQLKELQNDLNCWKWNELVGKKPPLFDLMVPYPQQATFKKRLRYLFIVVCPFTKHFFITSRIKEVEKEMKIRGLKARKSQ